MNPWDLRELLVERILAGNRSVSVHAPRRPDIGVIDLAITVENGRSTGLALKRRQIVELIDRLHEALDVVDGRREALAVASATEMPPGQDTAPAAYTGERPPQHGWTAASANAHGRARGQES